MTPEERISQTMEKTPAIPRLGIKPWCWWNEALHGVARTGLATVFPQSIGLAAAFDEDLVRRMAETIATETRAKRNLYAAAGEYGRYQCLTLWSPNVNMFRDPRWGRGQETYGEDPFLSGRLGCAFVRGLQGTDPRRMKTAACAKHFAVHSGPEGLRRRFDARVSKRDLAEYYLPAFETLVREGNVEAVMSAYNALDGVPCTANPYLLTDLLRGEWGFRGHVVSDAHAVNHILRGHRYCTNDVEVSKACIAAGLDLCSSSFYGCLYAAAKNGTFDTAALEKPIVNLLAARILLGDMDAPGENPWDSLGAADVATPAAKALALEAAEKSLVLVKNDGVLPLRRERHRRIAVVGPRAMDEEALYGNYNGYSATPSTCAAGMVSEAGPGWLVSVNAMDAHDDVAIACIGLTASVEGEEGAGGDRANYGLPQQDLKLLEKLKRRRIPVVAVVFGGSPFDLKPVEALCNAVVLAWYPGEQGGRAIARALLGRANFSGRLPVTYPESYADLPDFKDYSLAGRTYRYATKKPHLPFGFGLSYAKFAYSGAKAERKGATVRVAAKVRNAGDVAGEEVVQVYVKSPETAGDRRLLHLEGFKRVALKPGEEREVAFDLGERAFRVFAEDGSASVPPGAYTVSVGGGQPGFAQGAAAVVEM